MDVDFLVVNKFNLKKTNVATTYQNKRQKGPTDTREQLKLGADLGYCQQEQSCHLTRLLVEGHQ